MKTIFINILIFLYIYPINFIFLPQSTRVLMGVLGLVWFTLLLIQQKQNITTPRYIFKIFILLISIGMFSMISIGYNGTSDLQFIKYVFSMTAIVFASYFVVMWLKKLKYELNFKTISNLVINVIFIQSIIAFTMFLIPELRELLMGMEKLTLEQYQRIDGLSEFRIFGLGASKTFMAGVYNGYGLILIAILFRIYKFSSKQTILFSLKFLIIFFVGMMMARTTLVGAFLAFAILFMPNNLSATISMFRKRALFFFSLVILPTIVAIIMLVLFPSVKLILSSAFEYGFEMFVNYFEKGSFETASTNQLQTMYRFPTELKSWLIGDGYFAHPTDIGSYYMHTDVGYLRLLYYFGLLGLMAYLCMQVYLIVKAYKSFNISIKYYGFIIIYLLVLNLKGFTDLLFIHILFIMIYMMSKNLPKGQS